MINPKVVNISYRIFCLFSQFHGQCFLPYARGLNLGFARDPRVLGADLVHPGLKHLSIEAARGQQLGMPAAFHELTVVQNENFIRPIQASQAVGDP